MIQSLPSSGTVFLLHRYFLSRLDRDIFSLGFGPFRWICSSGLAEDLKVTDAIAAEVLESIVAQGLPDNIAVQYSDNIKWIREAEKNQLVVGSQARILYADQRARVAIALAFNRAIKGFHTIDINPLKNINQSWKDSSYSVTAHQGPSETVIENDPGKTIFRNPSVIIQMCFFLDNQNSHKVSISNILPINFISL